MIPLLRGLPSGQPRVDAKELEGIALLRRRRGLARLDMGPFVVGYALITAALIYHAIAGQWWACSRLGRQQRLPTAPAHAARRMRATRLAARPPLPRPPGPAPRRTFTLLSYGLGAAAALHVLALLFTVWSVDFRAAVTCSRAGGVGDADLVKVGARGAHPRMVF
jgi:hypothetical protein